MQVISLVAIAVGIRSKWNGDNGTGCIATAEAIAAELAASQAARPAVSMSTYAPANLMPGTGLQSRKRRPGAGMKGFMNIAGDLFKS